MKYKNISNGILEYRAFTPKGDKVIRSVKPGEIFESKEKINQPELEVVK